MSNLVEIMNNEVVTTSKQVAEVFGKLHKTVMRDIRNIIDEMNLISEEYGTDLYPNKLFMLDTYTAKNGKENPMYIMNRDGFTKLVMGYTGKEATIFQLQYIQAFNDMEKELKEKSRIDLSIPSYQIDDPVQRALVWAEETRQNQLKLEEKELIIEEQKPKVEYHDDVLNADDLMTATQVAKSLGLTSAKILNDILKDLKIQYKQSGNWVLYAKYTKKGYAKLITTRDGYKQLKWTEKGRQFIYKTLIGEGII